MVRVVAGACDFEPDRVLRGTRNQELKGAQSQIISDHQHGVK